MNNLYMLVGCSGSGKTTIQKMLEKQHDLKPLISYTTRPPRYEGEDNHIFITADEFKNLKDKVAYTKFCENEYCATTEQVEMCDTYVIDPDGIEFFKKSYRGNKGMRVIYIQSPIHTRADRMEERGDKFSLVLERITNDIFAFKGMEQKADFIVENGDGTKLVDVVRKIWDYIRTQEKLEE